MCNIASCLCYSFFAARRYA